MPIHYISEKKIEAMMEGPYDEFDDDSPDTEEWDTCQQAIRDYLLTIAPDEEADEADDTPGFLLQDICQNTRTITAEFNALELLNKTVLLNLAAILRKFSGYEMSIIVIPEDMYSLLIKDGEVYVPSKKTLRKMIGQ